MESTGNTLTETTGTPPARQRWSGQFGFIISAIGSAVGLGNIWRFPGVAYTNGGGAFLIPYLVALLTAGLPILFLDYAIGHRFRGSPPLAFRHLWKKAEALGWFQVMVCVFIGVYYAAILAWAGSYFVFSFSHAWGKDPATFFTSHYLHASATAGFHLTPVWDVFIPLAIVWVATIIVLAAKLTKGLEKVNVICIPLLVVAFVILVVRAVFLPGATAGLGAFFTPDFSKLGDASVWIAAYSQIFFSLSVGFGIMMTYNSYRARRSNQTAPGLVVGFANSSFEILAGIGVFSVLGFMATQNGQTFTQFAANAKISGVSLSFITFPKVVSQMPQPWLFGALFFGSLFMAAFTSMLSILEVVSSALQDKFGWTRRRAALTLGIPMAVVSLALFGSPGAEYAVDTVDKFTNEIGIVASAIMMIVAVLWIRRKGPELSYHLSSLSTFKVGRTWRFLVTFLAPVVLAVLLVSTVWDLVAHGYGGYPTWFVIVCGWGVLILILVGTVLFKSMGWKHSGIDDFTPWPLYPPLSAGVSKSAGRGGSAAKNAKGERA